MLHFYRNEKPKSLNTLNSAKWIYSAIPIIFIKVTFLEYCFSLKFQLLSY